MIYFRSKNGKSFSCEAKLEFSEPSLDTFCQVREVLQFQVNSTRHCLPEVQALAKSGLW